MKTCRSCGQVAGESRVAVGGPRLSLVNFNNCSSTLEFEPVHSLIEGLVVCLDCFNCIQRILKAKEKVLRRRPLAPPAASVPRIDVSSSMAPPPPQKRRKIESSGSNFLDNLERKAVEEKFPGLPQITKSLDSECSVLQKNLNQIENQDISAANFTKGVEIIKETAPLLSYLMDEISRNSGKEDKEFSKFAATSMLMNIRSQKCSTFQKMMGVLLYSTESKIKVSPSPSHLDFEKERRRKTTKGT